MTDIYPTLTTTDTADMQTLFGFVNTATGGLFWPVMLTVVWFIWVIGSTFSGKPVYRSVLFASFICSVLSIPLAIMSWLNPQFMYLLFLMTALSLGWTKLAESYS